MSSLSSSSSLCRLLFGYDFDLRLDTVCGVTALCVVRWHSGAAVVSCKEVLRWQPCLDVDVDVDVVVAVDVDVDVVVGASTTMVG